MYNLEKKGECTYLLPQTGSMLVPGLVIASQDMLSTEEMTEPLQQVAHVAALPGIVGYSIAMPDVHWGYGFPIGGVAAVKESTGVISPGGVGYDINCGVRLATISQPFSALSIETKNQLCEKLFELIPSGIGRGHQTYSLSSQDYQQLLVQGASWSIERGYGLTQDLEHMEENGVLQGADPSLISEAAKQRGKQQLGTIGSGNHFVEIGEIQEIFSPTIAQAWNVHKGDTYILIHSGSRGLGHQVCQDTLDRFMIETNTDQLVDRQLAYAPLRSSLGQDYLSAMAAAANYAFNNRQHILHAVRHAFSLVCGISPENIPLLYDVCHNIAKWEEHDVKGINTKLCVHRKGATRAFGPHHPELSSAFQQTGQPVVVPGDMGRASYLLVGTGNPLTWCSCCHGAGRLRSRIQSMKHWKGKDLHQYMQTYDVLVKATSNETLAEEMPDAYKDIDQVIEAVECAHLAKKVARCKPGLVIKG